MAATATGYSLNQILDMRQALGRKFQASDINHALSLAAFNWLDSYDGQFPWLLQRRRILQATNSLSNADIAGILNSACYDAEQARRKAIYQAQQAGESVSDDGRVRVRVRANWGPRPITSPQPPTFNLEEVPLPSCVRCHKPSDALSVTNVCPECVEKELAALRGQAGPVTADPKAQPTLFRNLQLIAQEGTYTIKYEDGSYTTVRVTDATESEQKKFKLSADGQFVGYLNGPDNSNDFQNIGTFDRGTLRIWAKHANKERAIKALNALLSTPLVQRRDFGVDYARISGNCYVCNRKLTTTESLEAGIGPTCAGRI